jgi:hypothetical protein
MVKDSRLSPPIIVVAMGRRVQRDWNERKWKNGGEKEGTVRLSVCRVRYREQTDEAAQYLIESLDEKLNDDEMMNKNLRL